MLVQHNDHAYFPYSRQIIQIEGIDYSCQREHNVKHKSKNVEWIDPFKGKCHVKLPYSLFFIVLK